jgi:predicted Zn-ribbon and HTH transcriptional regulator
MHRKERHMKYELKYTFFEAPNFSLTSNGETVVLGKLHNYDTADLFAKAYAVAVINSLGCDVKSIEDLKVDDDFCVEFDNERKEYTVYYKTNHESVIVCILSIEAICPHCGCNPHDEPYCMEPTHCPKCGYVFEV